MLDLVITFLMSLAMVIGFYLVLRRPLLWYFKIDEFLMNQRTMIEQMKKLNALLAPEEPKKAEDAE